MHGRDFILDSQVKAFQSQIPDTLSYKGDRKDRVLSVKEKRAIGRAIWYVVKLGYGCSTAVLRTSGSFSSVPKSVIERGLRETFPEDYFQHLARAKNKCTVIDLLEKK